MPLGCQSFCVSQTIFASHPWSSGNHANNRQRTGSPGISPPRGSHPAALIACDGSQRRCRRCFNARTVTGRGVGFPPPVMAQFMRCCRIICSKRNRPLALFGSSRRKVFADGLFGFQGTRRHGKCPSLSMPKSEGRDNLTIHHFFELVQDTLFAFMDCNLRYRIFLSSIPL